MKIKDINKVNIVLLGVIAILAVTFILSFTAKKSTKDKREVVKTSLVNPKYKDTITHLELSRGEDVLFLQKEQGIWFCETGGANEGDFYHIPAEQKKVEDFINQLTKILNLSKISYKNNDISSFGFNSDDQFTVLYDIPDSGFYEINFGNHDFSLSNRYVMGGQNNDLYEVDSSFERYLYTVMNQWYDPYIISRNINGEYKLSDVQRVVKRTVTKDGITTQTIISSKANFSESQKPSSQSIDFNDYVSTLLELRHGGAPQVLNQIQNEIAAYEPYNLTAPKVPDKIDNESAPKVPSRMENEAPQNVPDKRDNEILSTNANRPVSSLELTLEMGDTSEYNLRFFPNELTGKITVHCKYDFAPNRNRQITYTVEISQWTYEKILNRQ